MDSVSTQSFAAAPAQQNTGTQALDAIARTARSGQGYDKTAAREAAEQFEAVFLATVFDGLFQGVKTDGPFGGGQSEQMFRSLLNQEYAKSVAAQGGIGIADKVMSELQRLQEGV